LQTSIIFAVVILEHKALGLQHVVASFAAVHGLPLQGVVKMSMSPFPPLFLHNDVISDTVLTEAHVASFKQQIAASGLLGPEASHVALVQIAVENDSATRPLP
jgi:hypothetical protein